MQLVQMKSFFLWERSTHGKNWIVWVFSVGPDLSSAWDIVDADLSLSFSNVEGGVVSRASFHNCHIW